MTVFLGAWTVYLGVPFLASPGMRGGIFIASAEWNARFLGNWLLGISIGMIGLVVVLAITFVCFLADSEGPVPSPSKLAQRWMWRCFGCAPLLVPLWGFGFEKGAITLAAHDGAPTLERVATTGTISTFYHTAKGAPKLSVTFGNYGRVVFHHVPELASGIILKKGMTIPVSGRRTWVGTSYDTLEWPKEWLAQNDVQE